MTSPNAAALSVQFDFGSLNAPAWLQALGSVLAILLAIWLSHRTHARRRRDSLLAEARFARFASDQMETFWRMHDETMTRINDVLHEHLHDYDHFELHHARYEVDRFNRDLRFPLGLMEDMPWTSWPNPELAVLFWRMYAEVEQCGMEIDEMVDVPARRDGRERHDLYIDVYSAIQTLGDNPDVKVQFTRFADACSAYVEWAEKQGLAASTTYLAE